jgi:hypothetical protein
MKKALQILNIVTLILAIGVNYYFNSGNNGGYSMSEISGKYENLLTPAGYAFSIWGLIYLDLLLFVCFQARSLFNSRYEDSFVLDIGPWFILSNICNAAWVLAFTNDMIGLSVVIMFGLFFSLLKIILNTRMELWDAPFSIIFCIWWPFSIYFGWVNVAMIANLSVFFRSLGWDGAPLSETFWAIAVLIIAAVIFVYMTWSRNMREYALAGTWGIIAIGVHNLSVNALVAYVAFAIAVIVVINAMVHGYKNRHMGPIRSLRADHLK